MLFDVDAGEFVLAQQRLADEQRIFVVAAGPGEESAQHVVTERKVAVSGRRAVGDHITAADELALGHDRPLIDARRLIGAVVFAQAVDAFVTVGRADDDAVALRADDFALDIRQEHLAAVVGRQVFHARAHDRDIRREQRHRLALHVRSHERAVGVIVLQEGDQGSADAHNLARRDIHVIDAPRRGEQEFLIVAC